jgi:hypothetical protein
VRQFGTAVEIAQLADQRLPGGSIATRSEKPDHSGDLCRAKSQHLGPVGLAEADPQPCRASPSVVI